MFFFAALLFFSLLTQSNSLSLTGVVFDSNAKPVADARVHLEEPTMQEQWNADTKSDGTFRFDKLAYGNYRLTIIHNGYFESSAEVRLESSKTVEFTLAPAETVRQEVEV